MKNLIVIAMAMVFALGIGGIGFSAEKEALARNTGVPALCSGANCCHASKESAAVSEKKLHAPRQWSLNYWEALQRNGVDIDDLPQGK